MGHPSFTRKQATIINVVAGGLLALGIVSAMMQQSEEGGLSGVFSNNSSASASIGQIDTDRIIDADSEPGNWLSYGRDYGEQRHSPLTQINHKSIKDLELAFSVDMYTTRGLEASPIVVDGIMYMTSSWSVVYAVDATTGEEIWSYDPDF
jgi:quinohemoprotein ethanol dehydrogenase